VLYNSRRLVEAMFLFGNPTTMATAGRLGFYADCPDEIECLCCTLCCASGHCKKANASPKRC
jgi:hypothetical protein